MRIKYTMFLLAAILAACTNEPLPETIVEEAPESYTLVVTATKGNEDTTRALSLDGNKLNATWATGEVVQVYHVSNPGTEAEFESTTPDATLSAQGSGMTTTLSGSFTGSYTPAVDDVLRLRFLPNPYYTTQEGTLDYIATHCDYAVATITVASVDALTRTVTATAPASFENQQAVVKFALKKQDGTPLPVTSLTVNVGSTTYNVMPTAAASDFYVAVREASNKAVSLSAYNDYGKFGYEKAGITFEKGKYYAIGVKMTRLATLGDLYYSDGTFSTTLEEGKTPIGVIAYVGTDAFTENGVTLRDGTTTLQSHGLVLCLKHISHVRWRRNGMPAITETSEPLVNDTGDLKRTSNVSGYANTKFLAEKTDAAEDYPAAYQAWNYSLLPAPSSTTGWFLPSIQQWVRIMTALGGMSESDIVWLNTWKDTNLTSIHNLEAAMEKAGDMGNAYDAMSDSNRIYWSSSEASAGSSAALFIYPKIENSHQGLLFSFENKVNYFNYYVRPVLAF